MYVFIIVARLFHSLDARYLQWTMLVRTMGLSRISQSGTFLKVTKVIWHPNRGLSYNYKGDGNPAPKSNHTASTLAPRTTPDWHL